MDTLLQQYLNELKSSVNQMAGLVEETIVIATKALAKKDGSGLSRVFELESKINNYHIQIDRDCFKLLARQSPVASDLRLLIASIKMSVDLERMGDLACSISTSISQYLDSQPVAVTNDLPKMADLVRRMVRQGIDAFMTNDESLALEVLSLDETVDQYRDSFHNTIREQILVEQARGSSYLEVFTIVRNLERLGDHATNIAEEAIFLISGKDVRHQTSIRPHQVGEEI